MSPNENVVPLRSVIENPNQFTQTSTTESLCLTSYLLQTDTIEKTVPPTKLEELRNASRLPHEEFALMCSPLLALISNDRDNNNNSQNMRIERVEGNPGYLPTTSPSLLKMWNENRVFLMITLFVSGLLISLPAFISSRVGGVQSH